MLVGQEVGGVGWHTATGHDWSALPEAEQAFVSVENACNGPDP